MSDVKACECGWRLPSRARIGTDLKEAADAVLPYKNALIVSVQCPLCSKDWESKDDGAEQSS